MEQIDAEVELVPDDVEVKVATAQLSALRPCANPISPKPKACSRALTPPPAAIPTRRAPADSDSGSDYGPPEIPSVDDEADVEALLAQLNAPETPFHEGTFGEY